MVPALMNVPSTVNPAEIDASTIVTLAIEFSRSDILRMFFGS